MELRQLLYFRELAEQLNLPKAANNLYITPQALSKSMHKLSEEFGKELFFRDRGQLQLTSFGYEFYKETVTILNQILPMKERLENVAKQENKIISIGFSHGLLHDSIQEFISSFQKQFPEVKLDITELPDLIVEDYLLHDNFDIAFTIGPPTFPSQIKYSFLEHHQICIVVNPQHPFASKKEVTLSECSNYPIYTKNKFFKIHEILENVANDYKIKLNYQLESPSEILWRQLIDTTEGIGIGTTFYNTPDIETPFIAIPFKEKELNWDIYVAYKEGHYLSESTVNFLRRLSEFYAKHNQ